MHSHRRRQSDTTDTRETSETVTHEESSHFCGSTCVDMLWNLVHGERPVVPEVGTDNSYSLRSKEIRILPRCVPYLALLVHNAHLTPLSCLFFPWSTNSQRSLLNLNGPNQYQVLAVLAGQSDSTNPVCGRTKNFSLGRKRPSGYRLKIGGSQKSGFY